MHTISKTIAAAMPLALVTFAAQADGVTKPAPGHSFVLLTDVPATPLSPADATVIRGGFSIQIDVFTHRPFSPDPISGLGNDIDGFPSGKGIPGDHNGNVFIFPDGGGLVSIVVS